MSETARPGGIALGLERITRFLSTVLPYDPRGKLRIVHVAGTNGKGSVCALVSEVLAAAGYRVGTFNSPHFLEPNDALRIQGTPIPAAEYDALREWIRGLDAAAQPPNGPLSLFEQTTAAAFWWFAERSVDIAVVEVGMGGRRDATNVFGAADGKGIGQSLVQCICPVDNDHVGVIGSTVEEIAREKCGIMRPESWIVIANQDRADAFHKIRQHALRTSPGRIINVRRQPSYDIHVPDFSIKQAAGECAPLRPPADLPSWSAFKGTGQRCLRLKYLPSLDTSGTSSSSSSPSTAAAAQHAEGDASAAPGDKPARVEIDLPLVLPGYHQAGNASVAFYALDVLRTNFGFTKLTDTAIQVGFQNVRWPGRLSWLNLASRRMAHSGEPRPLSSDGGNSAEHDESLANWLLADGAHNEPAAVELRKYVDTTLRRIAQQRSIRATRGRSNQGAPHVRWIIGFSKGKDMAAILGRLLQPGDAVWAVPFAQPKDMPWIACEDPRAIGRTAGGPASCGEIAIESFDCLAAAVDRLAADASDDRLNVVCGSLYLVADVFRALEIQPFSQTAVPQ
ncbi:folylpolyglutamate synthase [Coemansia nantahalensis]|uniref:Folylpolyglutamate synthase n=1 Tax=Coemansia nantahalensis TaxID=2789366 RepID=A0ACC1JPA2_9FUNG|nr:folylpolyglutamate synthase [Coemansia nantahalensis]